jgi:hypothetical protein
MECTKPGTGIMSNNIISDYVHNIYKEWRLLLVIINVIIGPVTSVIIPV